MEIVQISHFEGIVEVKYGRGGECYGLGIKNILELQKKKTLKVPKHPYNGSLRWLRRNNKRVIIAKKVQTEENVRRIFYELVINPIKERFPGEDIEFSQIEIRYPMISISLPFQVNLQWIWQQCEYNEIFRPSAVRYIPQQIHKTQAKIRFHKYAIKDHQINIWNCHLVKNKMKFIMDIVNFLKQSTTKSTNGQECNQYLKIDYRNHDLYRVCTNDKKYRIK